MAKKKQTTKRARTNGNRSKLITYNANNYMDDINHLYRLEHINDGTRNWIENNMHRLRACANMYEIEFASYLMDKKIKFIHQAPFVFSGKVYFADFYLPTKRTIIEIDGNYHNGIAQSEYDCDRDACFKGNMIKVIRIPNSAVFDRNAIKIFMSQER